ncbi:uncharacterized protein K452DRAFT_297984 [Aplosporella prunicola CBS 121167]|uniref:Uncharacterized protein n=1 Tax=Aplosporella prunicola CBS 121167 TaxID=1176127 RepID=A0A6A6BEZ5_9PEZI|nr:uncharacterized protein K452DRAFT_297984 [Aplosporella prunicola CBS 121167]KAF2141953.1 hypothetical protein K452DRAFT_297984 [Aplosporella prunicola CBS 121167]
MSNSPTTPQPQPQPPPATPAILFSLEVACDLIKATRSSPPAWQAAKPGIDAAIRSLRLASSIEPGVAAVQEGRLRPDIRKQQQQQQQQFRSKGGGSEDGSSGSGGGKARQVEGEPAVVSERRLCGSGSVSASASADGRTDGARRTRRERFHPYRRRVCRASDRHRATEEKEEEEEEPAGRTEAASFATMEEAPDVDDPTAGITAAKSSFKDDEEKEEEDDGDEYDSEDDDNDDDDDISVDWTSSSHPLTPAHTTRAHDTSTSSLKRAVPLMDATPYRSALKLWDRRNAKVRREREQWMRYAMEADEQVEVWQARAERESEAARRAEEQAGVWRERCAVWEREAVRLMEVAGGGLVVGC